MAQPADTAIVVKDVYKSFRLPHEKHATVKSVLINVFRPKRYEKQQVLKDINFEIKKGDFFGIIGRNGSGKSTLLKLLAEIYTPDRGGININGKLTPFIELGVGFNPELTGRENVFLNGALLGFNRKQMEKMYQEIVDFAELERFMDQKLKNYSSGMQVRLAFSIAIRARSDILLLDEVLAVGDAAFQQKCFNYFEELKREQKTVVFVSHDMGAIRRFCTSAVYIEKGRITHRGNPYDMADVYAEENMEVAQKAKPEAENKAEKAQPVSHKISAKVSDEAANQVLLEVAYKSQDKEPMYIGIAILKDGISFAEITTSLQKPLISNGEVAYSLDTTLLNGGVYEIGVGLFRLKNREMLTFIKDKKRFIIKGSDNTKGGAVKLADTWKYD
ncbi:MAG TPA: ABC transporter ATP-binding protein [Candidatus Saccharimonadales bacterium]|nr:ABC transporter ATP-binding protein [Candidatus Saccharimonadales bacterium]